MDYGSWMTTELIVLFMAVIGIKILWDTLYKWWRK